MGKALLWVAVGVIVLIVFGSFVVSLVGTLVKLVTYLLVGVLIVGGAMYVVGKVRRGIQGEGPGRIER